VQGRLAGRVPAADHDRVPAAQRRRLAPRRSVVDAGSDERLDRRIAEPAIGHAGRDQHGARAQLAPVGQRHDSVAALGGQGRHASHEDEVRAEDGGLAERSHRELLAADSPREAEVVADHRGRAGLTARSLALDHDRLEALGRRGDRRGEPRRPRTDDREVVATLPGPGPHAERLHELRVRRPDEHAPVEEDDHRRSLRADAGVGERPLSGRGVRSVKGVRDTVPVEQVAQLVRAPGTLGTDDARHLEPRPVRARPLGEQAGHDRVEADVGGIPRLVDALVDRSRPGRLLDQVGRHPPVPVAQQQALRGRVQRLRLAQDLDAGRRVLPASGDDERDLDAALPRGLEARQSRPGGRLGADVVVRAVPRGQVAPKPPGVVDVVVEDEQERTLPLPSAACRRSRHLTNSLLVCSDSKQSTRPHPGRFGKSAFRGTEFRTSTEAREAARGRPPVSLDA
jgi:hypothetical protein